MPSVDSPLRAGQPQKSPFAVRISYPFNYYHVLGAVLFSHAESIGAKQKRLNDLRGRLRVVLCYFVLCACQIHTEQQSKHPDRVASNITVYGCV